MNPMVLSAKPTLLPVLHLTLEGQIAVNGQPVKATIHPGTRVLRLDKGAVFEFFGSRSGINLPDMEALRLSGSVSVSTWIWLDGYVKDGPGAQILFRGDDRCGLDPYTLVVHPDGRIHFSVQDGSGQGRSVWAEVSLRRWYRVTANFDSLAGRMEMYVGNDMVGLAATSVRPLLNLDRTASPGLGIGNIQNIGGPHNQPFAGKLADLRLYNQVVRPSDLEGRAPGVLPPQN